MYLPNFSPDVSSTPSHAHRNTRVARFREKFKAHVEAPDFPCVGARSAMNRGRARMETYQGLGRGGDVAALCDDLARFSADHPDPGLAPVTFIAMFDDHFESEGQFERSLWQHLRDMHLHDAMKHAWDPSVSDDPDSSDFSFSIAGRAFFVVGMSPVASRLARRSPMPCLVFNLHEQFELLRSSGKYEGMQRVIRDRDVALQGSINPVLARYGEASEARQYSGREVGPGWQCPFAPGAADAG